MKLRLNISCDMALIFVVLIKVACTLLMSPSCVKQTYGDNLARTSPLRTTLTKQLHITPRLIQKTCAHGANVALTTKTARACLKTCTCTTTRMSFRCYIHIGVHMGKYTRAGTGAHTKTSAYTRKKIHARASTNACMSRARAPYKCTCTAMYA